MAPKRKASGKSAAAEEPSDSKRKVTKASAKQDDKKPANEKPKGKGKAAAEKAPKADAAPSKRAKKSDSAGASKSAKDDKQDIDRVQPVTNPKETPEGVSRDNRGRLVFKDKPDFRPTLTPKQVIQAGSFGGIYFNPLGGRKSMLFPDGVPISADDFPKDWFEGLSDEQYKGKRYNIKLNKYKVKSGQNQQQWEEQGWIKKDGIDKRGWFQWYCHFTLGRRTDDDERQISRWTGVAGPKGRWKKRLFNLVKDKDGDIDNATISPVIRQNLLHWAYELTKGDYEALLKGEQ